MARSVGLDFHTRGVRAVEVVGNAKKWRVTRYAQRDVAPRGGAADPDELRDSLNELFKELKFDKSTVITDVGASETVVREIPVPFKADDQIRKVIKYEVEHHLHDCDADDVVVQFTRVAEKEEGTDLLVFAARKDDLRRLIEASRSAGVEPLAMDLDALAFYNIVRASGELEKTPDCVLLVMGYAATSMIMVQDGKLRALRSIRLAVDTITHALARDMDIDPDEAGAKVAALGAGADEGEAGDLLVGIGGPLDDKKETEKSHAELEEDLFRQRRDELVRSLKREYVRSGAAMQGNQPSRMLVAGPGLRIHGLLERLQARLGLAVEAFHPCDYFQAKLGNGEVEDLNAEGSIALGLALKGLGVDPLRIDFRQEDLRVANKFDLLKVPLAITVSLLFVALFAAAVFFYYKRTSLREKLWSDIATDAFTAFQQVAATYNKVSPERRGGVPVLVDPDEIERRVPPPEVLSSYLRELRRMRSKLKREFGDQSDTHPIVSALRTWNGMFAVIREHHKEVHYFDIEHLLIRQDHVSMTIIVESVPAGTKLEDYLKAMPAFEGWDAKASSYQPVKGTSFQRTTLVFEKKRKRRRR